MSLILFTLFLRAWCSLVFEVVESIIQNASHAYSNIHDVITHVIHSTDRLMSIIMSPTKAVDHPMCKASWDHFFFSLVSAEIFTQDAISMFCYLVMSILQ